MAILPFLYSSTGGIAGLERGCKGMAFPKKFRSLLESTSENVTVPTYVFLTYAVCGMTPDACGWSGWVLDGVFEVDGIRHNTATGDKLLSSISSQICPNCGRETFRTAATFELDQSESSHHIGSEPENSTPLEYKD